MKNFRQSKFPPTFFRLTINIVLPQGFQNTEQGADIVLRRLLGAFVNYRRTKIDALANTHGMAKQWLNKNFVLQGLVFFQG